MTRQQKSATPNSSIPSRRANRPGHELAHPKKSASPRQPETADSSLIMALGNERQQPSLTKASRRGPSLCRRRVRRLLWRAVFALGLMVVSVVCVSIALVKPVRTSPSPWWEAALELAEKGAEETIRRLESQEERSKKGNRAQKSFTYLSGKALGKTGGSCYVTVTELDRFTRLIDATGIVHDQFRTLAQRTIRVKVRRIPLFESALSGRQEVFLDANVEIDSYDSAQESRCGAMHGTRKQMEVGWRGEIGQELVVSQGKVMEAAPPTGVEGTRRDRELPLIVPPWGLPAFNGIALSGGDVLCLNRGGSCPFITVADGSNLIIDSDVDIHVMGPLTITGRSQLIVAEDATKVSLYVEEDVLVERESAIVNLTGRPSSFSIWGTDRRSSIIIDSRQPFRGTIYAPNAEIRIGPGVDFFGAAYGRTIHVLRGAHLHYDKVLSSISPPSCRYAVVSRQPL